MTIREFHLLDLGHWHGTCLRWWLGAGVRVGEA